jgi:hypothetical protein
MIMMLLTHPAAFIACLLSYSAVAGVYDWTGRGDPSIAVALTVMIGSYLVACWVLPWWTRPTLLIRYLWRRRQVRRIERYPAPTWMHHRATK